MKIWLRPQNNTTITDIKLDGQIDIKLLKMHWIHVILIDLANIGMVAIQTLFLAQALA
jgi:hypothetical protein